MSRRQLTRRSGRGRAGRPGSRVGFGLLALVTLRRAGTEALAPLLFLSGAAALTYEVLWARDWALLLGSTAAGTAIVLAVYFGGLALGAALGARLTTAWPGPRLWAALEAGVATAAIGYVALRPALPAGAVWAVHAPGGRALLAVAALILPTTLLGATLPAAAAMLPAGAAPAAGRLYAWNTLGGAAGALACAGIGIRALGVRGTFLAAAGADVAVALAASVLLRPGPAPEARPAVSASAPALALATVAGFAGLANEVLWARGLAAVLSNSVYSVALVLAAVLGGLVIGAALGARAAGGPRVPARIATAFTVLGLATLASLFALRALPGATALVAVALRVTGPAAGLAVEAAVAALVVLAPAVALGAILPLLLALDGARPPGRTVGRILAANTAGGIAGALLAAFVLLPGLGLGGGLLVTAGAAAVAALVLAERRLPYTLAPAAIGLVALVAPSVCVVGRGDDERVLFYRDGATATVTVTADARGARRLRVNGQYSLGGTAGVLLERREAHVPLLLHPAPARMLALGVGTADTIGAAVAHPGLHVDGVEIVPEALAAARWFAAENGGVLANPRVHLVVDDARSYLLATPERWDVILSDLFLPWTAGTASLYSLDFYRLGRARLRPGGLYCQWLPLHQLDVADLAAIVASFTAAFPHVQLWVAYHRAATPLAALIGSAGPLRADAAALRARARDPDLAAALHAAGLDDPADLAVLYIGDERRLRPVVAEVAPITDDRPRLEFTAPAAYFHQHDLGHAALAWIAARLDPAPAPVEGDRPATFALRAALLEAQLALLAHDGPAELHAYLDALSLAPDVPSVRAALTAIAAERITAGDSTTTTRITEILRSTADHAPLGQRPP